MLKNNAKPTNKKILTKNRLWEDMVIRGVDRYEVYIN